ncbi:peptidase C19 family protein [Tieghemostelium lacteum]|uniref:Peptidase C19 family protein n=1 Tax=Tieghemostelium lacteum TaxID=361077 RepID=A0A151ZER5_TIELA|nr:peptidase C19 family protein [Tieghemostelium lacteum]|eukprot:KYQ92415.1 peptidase C19 family protein [Tieghemostelium lacteum]
MKYLAISSTVIVSAVVLYYSKDYISNHFNTIYSKYKKNFSKQNNNEIIENNNKQENNNTQNILKDSTELNRSTDLVVSSHDSSFSTSSLICSNIESGSELSTLFDANQLALDQLKKENQELLGQVELLKASNEDLQDKNQFMKELCLELVIEQMETKAIQSTPVSPVPLVPIITKCPIDFSKLFVESRKRYSVGLKNIGLTCYQNTSVQILFHTLPFRNYVLVGMDRSVMSLLVNSKDSYENTDKFIELYQLKCNSMPLYPLFSSLQETFIQMVLSKDSSVGLDTIRKYLKPQYSGKTQECACEFMMYLLNSLESTHLAIKQEEQDQERDELMEEAKDPMESDEIFARYLEKVPETNFIREIFGIKKHKEFKCSKCFNNVTKCTEDQLQLYVPIYNGSPKSLSEMVIDSQFQIEKMSNESCQNPLCKSKGFIHGSTVITHSPKCLVVQLQRVVTNSLGYSFVNRRPLKECMTVQLPVTKNSEDGSSFIQSLKCYQLYAVGVHQGTQNSGHWYSYCKTSGSQSAPWFKFNDHNVNQIIGNYEYESMVQDIQSNGTIYFFTKVIHNQDDLVEFGNWLI